tara:strand:+ start:2119 stop:2352 length:234 start_codon:yes stop_codon:yes gene_type:complete
MRALYKKNITNTEVILLKNGDVWNYGSDTDFIAVKLVGVTNGQYLFAGVESPELNNITLSKAQVLDNIWALAKGQRT